jgi:hypothetical protein
MAVNFQTIIFSAAIVHVDRVHTRKDLGIIIDQRLTFNFHINNLVARAHAKASLIHQCFCLDIVTL